MTRPHSAKRVCAAGCGIPLHPAAAAGGHTTHPGCDPATGPTGGRRVFRWACLACGGHGPAVSAQHAAHLTWVHDVFACPAAASISAEERALRIARHRNLTARYPGQAPPWPPVGGT